LFQFTVQCLYELWGERLKSKKCGCIVHEWREYKSNFCERARPLKWLLLLFVLFVAYSLNWMHVFEFFSTCWDPYLLQQPTWFVTWRRFTSRHFIIDKNILNRILLNTHLYYSKCHNGMIVGQNKFLYLS
jgi:hypothetical protein